jgi:hypothetical protein
MPKPVILFENPHAVRFQELARPILDSEPEIARGHLWAALAAIQDNVRTDFDCADTAVQIARIREGEAHTYAREAIRPFNITRPTVDRADSFRRAFVALQGHALDQTGPYVSGKKNPRFIGDPTAPHDPEYEMKLLVAHNTHTKILSKIARIATAELVLGEETEETEARRGLYHSAHLFASAGNDASTLIGNALFAARDARLEKGERGREATRWWVKRATSGLLWALRNDPSNFVSSWKAYRRGRTPLTSARAARDSVLAGA